MSPNTDPWGTPPVTGRQLHFTPFTATLWSRLSRHFLTQQSVYLSVLPAPAGDDAMGGPYQRPCWSPSSRWFSRPSPASHQAAGKQHPPAPGGRRAPLCRHRPPLSPARGPGASHAPLWGGRGVCAYRELPATRRTEGETPPQHAKRLLQLVYFIFFFIIARKRRKAPGRPARSPRRSAQVVAAERPYPGDGDGRRSRHWSGAGAAAGPRM